jgi:hypothetical protein
VKPSRPDRGQRAARVEGEEIAEGPRLEELERDVSGVFEECLEGDEALLDTPESGDHPQSPPHPMESKDRQRSRYDRVRMIMSLSPSLVSSPPPLRPEYSQKTMGGEAGGEDICETFGWSIWCSL